jgi:hypothetical protein
MAYAALDYFYTHQALPPDTTAPVEGNRLHTYIYNRQWDAHGSTWRKFGGYYWWLAGIGLAFYGITVANSDEEVDKFMAYMSQNHPMPICLAGMGKGHHLVGYAGESTTSGIKIKAYNPNFPGKEDLITRNANGDFVTSLTGSTWGGFFVDDGYSTCVPAVTGGEKGWRWCRKCQGMFYNSEAGNLFGKCPADGAGHDPSMSGKYILPLNTGSGEAGWRWCPNCEGLYFAGVGVGPAGVCPAGGTHGGDPKFDYALADRYGLGQDRWFWCKACQGLFFFGGGAIGICPANPNGHDGSASPDYFLPQG